MKPSSGKAKGRRLQDKVCEDLNRKLAPYVRPGDIRPAIMGESGCDIKLSPAGREAFPFSVECKNVERLNVWQAYDQAKGNSDGFVPLLVIKKNRRDPLVVLDWSTFLELVL
jgi:hypothetical protein